MTLYPAQIDNGTSLPAATDLQTPVVGGVVNALRDAILRIESELGIQPSSIYGTVRNRLDALGTGTLFAAGGDLSGSSISQTVIGLQSRPISSTLPTLGEGLVWNGVEWAPGSFDVVGTAGGDLLGIYPDPTVVALLGIPISSTPPLSGQVLEYNGTNWIATSLPTGFTAGGDLSGSSTDQTVIAIQGISISNAVPTSAQVLEYNSGTSKWTPTALPSSLPPSGSAGGDLTGSYPDPTIASITGAGGLVSIGATIRGNSSPVSYAISNVMMSSDANVTLSSAQYSSPILRITSSISLTATRSVILPATSGAEFQVFNNTTGGQSLLFIASTGTGITVPNKLKTTIYFDGTNYVTSDIVVGGDLSAISNIAQTVIALQGNPVSSGVLSSAQDGYALTWEGTTWTAEPLPSALPPSGSAGGNLSGSYPNPTVAAINGTTVPATPTANQVLVATSGTAATWEQIVNAQISTTAAVAVSKLAAGTSAQILQNNGTPTPTWTSISGDVSITNAGITTIASISGSGGFIPFGAVIEGTSGSSFPVSYAISNVSMGSDANLTLSPAQLICPILRITSSVSLTATRSIILPAQSGAEYDVYNGTTGGQSLLFVASSGSGVTLPNGLKTTVYFDGTNYVTSDIVVGGDLSATTNVSQTVIKIQGNAIANTAPTNGYVLTWNSGTSQWAPAAITSGSVTLSGDVTGAANANTVVALQGNAVASGTLTSAQDGYVLSWGGTSWSAVPASSTTSSTTRPPTDSYTLLDYRFNETSVLPGLINHGSYGTGSATIGPSPTTTTANFTQPASGSTVVVSVASTTNYAAGEMIFVGGGAGYYYCTATGSGTLTLKNLAISGSNAAPTTVITSGASVTAKVDLLVPGTALGYSLGNNGPYDWCWGFNGTDQGNVTNYGLGGSGGGIGAFTGITQFSMHVLVWLNAYTTSSSAFSLFFGYSHAQSWGTTFRDTGIGTPYSGTPGQWTNFFTNQSMTIGSFVANGNGNYPMTLGQWCLLSFTADLTATTGAFQFYKNGQLVGTSNASATGTFAFGSGGYWYVGNPNPTGGDTGDSTNGMIAMCRFENTIRSASYIRSMWNSIFPAAANWPVP